MTPKCGEGVWAVCHRGSASSQILPNDAQMYADGIGTIADNLVILDIFDIWWGE